LKEPQVGAVFVRRQQRLTDPLNPVAKRAHGDERPGDQETVNVNDPEELRAGGREICAQRWQREVQDGQIHRVEQARQRNHPKPNPLAAASLR